MWFIFRFLLSFLFLAQVGPDGLGPPNNRTQLSCSADVSLMFDVPKRDRMSLITCLCRTVCTFTPGERMLSEKIRHLTAFRSIIRWRAGKKCKTCCRFPQLQSLASLVIPPLHPEVRSVPILAFRRIVSCISGARWASFAASGQPFAWPEYVGRAEVAPTLASWQRGWTDWRVYDDMP